MCVLKFCCIIAADMNIFDESLKQENEKKNVFGCCFKIQGFED